MRWPKDEFRIVTDAYAGFEVQRKRWWLPIWLQYGGTNTHSNREDARRYFNDLQRGRPTYKNRNRIGREIERLETQSLDRKASHSQDRNGRDG